MAVWPTDGLNAAIEFIDCVGDRAMPTGMVKPVAPRGTLLISSWTRRHSFIWSREAPSLDKASCNPVASEYTVRFTLAISNDRRLGPIPVVEIFDVRFRTVRVLPERKSLLFCTLDMSSLLQIDRPSTRA